MNAILKLEQGSDAWHEHRQHYRNASETASVMGLSPWCTPYDLWLIKTGRKEVEETEAMRYGSTMEPQARLAFEEMSGLIMQPKVMVDGDYSASLDGITLDGQVLLEVKCPFKGQASELWQVASSGTVPEHYLAQVQHQLMVSKAKLAHLWVYDGTSGIQLDIKPDPLCFESIKAAWEAFQPYLDKDQPPPLSEADTLQRFDSEWKEAADAYLGWKSLVEEAQAKVDTAKARLLTLAKHNRESGYGVTVTRYWKQGSIDYKKIPALQTIDLEPYRKAGSEEVRITIAN